MCSSNDSSFQCLNGGYCRDTNTCICASVCFGGSSCEINYNAAHLPLVSAIIQDLPEARIGYIVFFLLYGFIGLINNILALTTFVRERIRITAYGVYLILFSILGLILTLAKFTYIFTVIEYNSKAYKLSSCHAIPYISLIMADGGALCTVAIALERVLIECFNFHINGSRIRGFVISFLIIVFAAGSNIDEIFIRSISKDTMGRDICIYDFDKHSVWGQFDLIFSYTHVIIPFVAHCVCSICVLTTIARRKIFIRSTEHKFCREWLRQLYFHRDFFIPPVCLILCMLPHGIAGHILKACMPYTDKVKLRLHCSFVLLLFVPQILTFILYVYPNEIYWKEFQQTFIYRKFCFYCYHKQRRLRQEKLSQSQVNKQRKASTSTDTQDSIIVEQKEGIV